MSSKEIISPKNNIKSEVPIAINSKINNAEIPFAIEKKDEIEKKEIKYGETSYRWFFLISYCLSGFVNQMQWVAYSAILTAFSTNYEKPLWKINMFSLIYMIVYPIVCIPEAWMLDKFSIRISLILAAACNILGSGLKLLVNKDKSLASCYIGQTISCLFQPILLNSPGKIAANWFKEDIRTVICTVCCLAVTTGALVGFLWNLMFID
jgi:MFS family permease